MSCLLYLGAFYRSSPGYFDDVVIGGTDPPAPTFTTGVEPTFPAAMLNNTQPSGYASGTGGTDAINRVIPLTLAEIPRTPQSTKSAEVPGLRGQPLYVRMRSAPNDINLGVSLPGYKPGDTGYNQAWDALRDIAFRNVYIWALTHNFAFKGFISEGSDVFLGERHKDKESLSFKVKYFYTVTLSGTTRTYKLLGYD